MSKRFVPLKVAALVTLVAVALASLAVTSAFAAGSTTSATSTQVSTQVLQNSWKSELSQLNLDNVFLSRGDKILVDFGRRKVHLDRVSGGSEMTLGAFDSLLTKAQAAAKSHAGFDATGKVTDQTQALKSVQTLGAYLDQLRGTFIYHLRRII